MKAIYFVISILLFSSNLLWAQTNNEQEHKDLVNWMTLTEALEKQKKEPRKIFIDIYTDWCGWCKVMSKNTFSHPQIAAYINQYFYPVRYDAEGFDTIMYLEKQYVNENAGKRNPTHQLAYVLTNNRPSYPTITYLDEKAQLIQALPGYMDVNKIEPYLVYFNENAFRSAPFETFQANFDKTFRDSTFKPTPSVQWLTFEDAEKLAKIKPLPLLIDIRTDWSVTSRVMETTTFTDTALANYINRYFYAVNFDPTSKEPIVFGGKTYVNQGVGHPFHDLALMLSNRQIGIPSTIYLNEKLELLSSVPGYRSPNELKPILVFFGEGIYKTKQWVDFINEYNAKNTVKP